MQATSMELGKLLAEYGWQYEQGDDGLLVSGFLGKNGSFRIFLQADGPWVVCIIIPFVPRPKSECLDHFCRYLARLNYRLHLARFALDADGDVALLVELPSEDLRFTDLAAALDALCFYADLYYPRLAQLALDPVFEPAEDPPAIQETKP